MIPDNEAPEGEDKASEEPKTEAPEAAPPEAAPEGDKCEAPKHVRLGGEESELVKSSAGGDQAPVETGHTRLGAPEAKEADKEDGA